MKGSDKVTFELRMTRTGSRAAALLIGLALVGGLALVAAQNFVIGVLTDERVSPPLNLLESAIVYFPESARLNARLSEYELGEEERNLSLAEFYARQAIHLSPWDYNRRLQLVDAEEADGNRDAAEESLRAALELAPNNADVHWRLANLLLRLGKGEESVNEFRRATAANGSLLGATLDLIWRASGGRVDEVEAVTGPDTKLRLVLAQFLLKQSQVSEAASIFRNVDRRQRLQSPEASAFLSMVIDSGRPATARDLWLDTVGGDGTSQDGRASPVWNGSFEADPAKNFPQFDWHISSSQYARIALISDVAHTGSRSLRIDFTGRDTTRIDGEIRQLVVVRSGWHYEMECYAKSERLVTAGGPCLSVLDARSLREIATSAPVPAGSNDWRRLSCEFITPDNCEAVLIEIRRLPKFSYDDPTQGTVWFDDFALIGHGGER